MTQKFIRRDILTPTSNSNNDTKYICTFENPDVYWYAYGVYKLSQKPFKDRDSWKFMAAIHGFKKAVWRKQENYKDAEELPSQIDREVFWDQCQHGTWYFLPWHRGYLLALEIMLRKEIINGGGPENWSLPYWDFTQKTTLTEEGKEKLRAAKRYAPEESYTPEAFLVPEFTFTETINGIQQAPQTVPNPLYVKHRYNIYDFKLRIEKLCKVFEKVGNILEQSPIKFAQFGAELTELLKNLSSKEKQLIKDFISDSMGDKNKRDKALDSLAEILIHLDKTKKQLNLLSPDAINEHTQKALSAPSFYKECEFGGSFGGPKTGFCHGSGVLGNLMLNDVFSTHGLVENFPHDIGHIVAGGFGLLNNIFETDDDKTLLQIMEEIKKTNEANKIHKDNGNEEEVLEKEQNLNPGLLTQPDTAGMDPLFYLHHVNQDRVWDSWLALPDRKNPEKEEDGLTGEAWLNGPDFNYRHFYMPMDKEQVWKYTPKDMTESSAIKINGKECGYAYDSLIPFTGKTALLLEPEQTLVGSSKEPKENHLPGHLKISVTLVEKELKEIHENERYFLNIEGIRSGNDEALLFVQVNSNTVQNPERIIPLFGLKNESDSSNLTGGQGMSKRLNITEWASLLVNKPTLELEFFSAMNGNITIQQVVITKMKVKQDKSA